MDVNYYELLSKAVTGKNPVAREIIYNDALRLIKQSQLTREAAASHTEALEDAIEQIEDEFAAEETSAVLATKRNWKPLALAASVVVVGVALSALVYSYYASKRPVGAGLTASSSKAARAPDDAVVADLKPGVDGGSTGDGLPFAYQRQVVFYRTHMVPGSIVVDRENRFLYLIDARNSARRYGIGIAQECQKSGSFFRVTNKMEWPDWKSPNSSAQDANNLLASAGRPGSQLGARALLLDKPGLLIHGTNSPKTIGHLVSSGCIRLVNDDVEDLYRRVSVETQVVFLS